MSDLKELLQDAIQCCYDTDGFGVDFENGDNESGILLGDALSAVEDVADNYNGWISVDERFPDERCLAYTPENVDPNMMYRIIPAGLFKQIATDATHWMPLPNPPQNK